MSADDLRVAELRSLVSAHLTPYYDTHFNLLRWIQAQPGVSVDKIAARLRHHLLFRASTWGVDSIHKRERGYHSMHTYWPRTRSGPSGVIDNCVVHIEQSGFIDFDGIVDNFSIPEVLKGGLHNLECMLAEVMKIEEETGKQASILYIQDMQGMEYSKRLFDVTMRSLRGLSEFTADHYPELMNHYVVVNVPSWAYAIYRMVKPMLPERTKQKVRMLSSNWRDEIRSYLDPSVGPVFWNNDDHNDFGMPMERPIDIPRQEAAAFPEKADKLHVKAGKVHWLDYNLEKGDVVSFHIQGNNNFGFTIVHVDNEDDDNPFAMRQLYPLFTCMPGPLVVPLEDSVTVPETGLYKIWFSNTRAWWSSLTIQHCIKVTKSKQTE